MATKLFKIGEYSYFGKWRITVNDELIKVEGIDWFSGKIEVSRMFEIREGAFRELRDYLEEVSTSYWAGKMMEFVSEHTVVPEIVYVAGGVW